ncbi:recombinase family protein [Frondihabitans peucedani]|uniref:Resolvase/invertase-type recombinase catalytic domain-containing protein n=1 Tax=Frondihabitans peucedani TaxID=598626 RepID=A0ABP8E6V0_9MICO
MVRRAGYIRLSRDDSKSLSIENQERALSEYDPDMPIWVDRGVSGSINLTDATSEWSTKVRPFFAADPVNTEIVVYTFDRLGRSKGAVLFEVETMTKAGGSLHVIREGTTFTDAEDLSQAIELTFRSLSDESYRTEGRKKTQRAIDALKAAEVPLGRKPSLTEKQITEIKKLHSLDLGLTSIGKAVRTKRKKDGVMTATSPRVIARVLAGEYESREAYERRDLSAREAMAARAVLDRIGERA